MDGDLGGSPSGQQSAERHFPLGNEFLEPVGPEEELGQSDHFYEAFQHSFLSDIPLVSDLPQHTTTAHPLPLQSSSISGGSEAGEHRLSAKRTQKADREKLRRDRLNDQFLELANALDSDLVKNDKASILVESLQAVRELRAEVKRLKTEHASLLNETRDLTEEKNELREEKASLRSETERLQSQLGQCLHSISPWMSMDPSIMMPPLPPSPFPFPIPGLPQYVSMHPSSSHHVPPYIPLPSSASIMNTFPSHQPLSRVRSSTSLGTRAIGETSHSSQRTTTIERPSAQYPVLVQSAATSAASFMRIPLSQKGSQAKTMPAVPLERPISAITSAFSQSSQGFQKGKESHGSCIPPTNQGDRETGWHQNPPPNSSLLAPPIQACGLSSGKQQDLRPESCRAFQIREHSGSSLPLVHEAESRGKATVAAKLTTELVNPFPSLSGSLLANELEGLPLCDSLQGGFDPDYDAILRPPAA